MRYSVSYDLLSPGKNYQKLYDALSGLGAKRVLLSQWVTSKRTGVTAAAIREHLRPFIDANDRLFVICLDNGDWATWNHLIDPNTI